MDTSALTTIGGIDLNKGEIRPGITLYAWDSVQECRRECPVADRCTYPKKGKCSVQVEYLKTLYSSILSTYKYLDEPMLFKIGMQIIPLYVTLVKMQILEMSLNDPMMITEKGGIAPHPVYKEIRETLKAIHMMWKDLDLSFSFGGKIDPSAKEKEPVEGEGDVERGDPTYYEKISKMGPSQKGVIR